MDAPNNTTNDQRADLLKRWVDALRSGKYQQGRGRLQRDSKYCCLGVLCDLSGLGEWTYRDGEMFYAPRAIYNDEHASVLPTLVRCVAGVGNLDGEEGTYISMNDSGATFAEIADAIERNHPDVFGVPAHA